MIFLVVLTERRNMKKSLVILLSLGFLLPLIGCNQTDKMPGIDVPIDEMNNVLQIILPKESDPLRVGEKIILVVENHSDKPIILDHDLGENIFKKDKDQWISIENDVDSSKEEVIIYPKTNVASQGTYFIVDPQIVTDQPVTIRIVIIGNYSEENNKEYRGEQVGAYIDIDLEP